MPRSLATLAIILVYTTAGAALGYLAGWPYEAFTYSYDIDSWEDVAGARANTSHDVEWTPLMTSPITTPAQLGHVAPFFIVRDVEPAIAFYRDRLRFDVAFLGPGEGPYFAMLQRGGAWIMLKAITPQVLPTPNPGRHPWARWDAYVYTPDPDALAEEFASRGVAFREPLGVNADNLRGFEVADVDGYVLYFGRPA